MSSNFSLTCRDTAQAVATLCTLLTRRLGQLGTRWGHTKLRGTFLVLVSASPECFQPVPFQGWCNNRGPWESDVKASLPFHGALLWPFHRVKPKEIHVRDLCGASLHSGTVRKKKKVGLGMKRAQQCAQRTHDPWTLTFTVRHKGEGAVGFDRKTSPGVVDTVKETLVYINMLMMWICRSVY